MRQAASKRLRKSAWLAGRGLRNLMDQAQPAGLRVLTACGDFLVHLEHDRAPQTCRYFAALAADGRLDNSSVFRIVTPDNEVDEASAISVVQLGLWGEPAPDRVRIGHESTDLTGLSHKRWTVSAARFEAGEVYGSFFVCMRDEPCLDHGGARHPDRKGFAAFGTVVEGQKTLEDLYGRADSNAMLADPIAVYRIAPEAEES